AASVTAANGRVWAAIRGPGKLVEVDPISSSIGPHVNVGPMEAAAQPIGPVPCTLAGSGNTVWAPVDGEGTSTLSGIWRVDALHARVSGVIHLGGEPCGISLGHGKVWVSNPSNYEVDEFDPRTSRIQRIHLRSSPNAIASAPNYVWVVTD